MTVNKKVPMNPMMNRDKEPTDPRIQKTVMNERFAVSLRAP